MRVFEPVKFRPPAESRSVLLRATRGCSWNRCAFCNMYLDMEFQVRSMKEIKEEIEDMARLVGEVKEWAAQHGMADQVDNVALSRGLPGLLDGEVRGVFLGDGNALIMKTRDLAEVIEALHEAFPALETVACYGMGRDILNKGPDELRHLREAGLNYIYMGLETGDDELLGIIDKGVSQRQMIDAGIKVKEAGMILSQYVILGLGGRERWQQHADGTAYILNRTEPDFIRPRTIAVLQGTPLFDMQSRGQFTMPSPQEILTEERRLLEGLDVTSEFQSDHHSNYLSLSGKLPEDKEYLIAAIDWVLAQPPEVQGRLLRRHEGVYV